MLRSYELNLVPFDFRVDFLILSADSGAWYTTLIELESPNAKPFNKNGTPGRSLARGMAQLVEWKIWIENNKPLLRQQLAKFLKKKREGAHCSNAVDHELAHTEIIDPRTVIHHDYIVVVGRRLEFDQEAQERRGVFQKNGTYIASYDRLLDAAKRIDWSRPRD